MDVNYIEGGSQAFNALLYKQPDNNFLSYLESNIQNAAQSLGSAATGFIDRSRDLYNSFNNSELFNAGRNLLMSVGMHFSEDAIYPIKQNNMGSASLTMQRYIMAYPEIQDLYHKNLCHGYQETYVDTEPDVRGKDRAEYMAVMDGVNQFDTDGNGYINYYSFEDSIITKDLTYHEKFSILETWDNVASLIAKGIDPTSPDLDTL